MKTMKLIKPFIYLGIIYIAISFLLRLVFMFHPITTSDFGIVDAFKMLFAGALSDVFVFVLVRLTRKGGKKRRRYKVKSSALYFRV